MAKVWDTVAWRFEFRDFARGGQLLTGLRTFWFIDAAATQTNPDRGEFPGRPTPTGLIQALRIGRHIIIVCIATESLAGFVG